MITDHELSLLNRLDGVFALRVACDQAVQQSNKHLFIVRSVFVSQHLGRLQMRTTSMFVAKNHLPSNNSVIGALLILVPVHAVSGQDSK